MWFFKYGLMLKQILNFLKVMIFSKINQHSIYHIPGLYENFIKPIMKLKNSIRTVEVIKIKQLLKGFQKTFETKRNLMNENLKKLAKNTLGKL